jgi:hypothetical protein
MGSKRIRYTDEDDYPESVVLPLVNRSDLRTVAEARIKEIGKKKPDIKAILTDNNIDKMVLSPGYFVYAS